MPPITALTNPECTQCNMKFARTSFFDMYMKKVHGETDHLRINRLSKTVKEVLQPDPKSLKKSLDCTECGICFMTREDQVEHNRNNHEQKVDNMQKNTELKFACNLCDKPCDSKGFMVNHMILIHTVRTKDIYCDFCD